MPDWWDWRWTVAAVAAVAMFAAGVWRVTMWSDPSTTQATAPSPLSTADSGGQAPSLEVATVDGGTFTIPADGRPTVVFFMAGWCATCIPEAEALAAIHRDLGQQVAILAVDADPQDPLSSLRAFIDRVGDPGYAWAHDPNGAAVTAFQVKALDTTVVIDADGTVVYRDAYPTDEDTLRQAIARARG